MQEKGEKNDEEAVGRESLISLLEKHCSPTGLRLKSIVVYGHIRTFSSVSIPLFAGTAWKIPLHGQ